MNASQLLRLAPRIGVAVASNLLARFLPGVYVRLTEQTGRGAGETRLETVVDYFERCYDDYVARLARYGVPPERAFAGQRVLEYGPGDLPGVALLMLAHGARQVVCVDRFSLAQWSAKNVEIVRLMLARQTGDAHDRMAACFVRAGDPLSGLRPEFIAYHVSPNGLSGASCAFDRVISRAVLEHVNDLPATVRDMHDALVPGGIALHQVDLKSHGLHRSNPLDFLEWPVWLWNAMYGAKGFPNRLRVDVYRALLAQSGLVDVAFEPTAEAAAADVAAMRARLAPPFRTLSDADLAWLGFWLVCRKPDSC